MGEYAINDAEIVEHLKGAWLDTFATRTRLGPEAAFNQSEGNIAPGKLTRQSQPSRASADDQNRQHRLRLGGSHLFISSVRILIRSLVSHLASLCFYIRVVCLPYNDMPLLRDAIISKLQCMGVGSKSPVRRRRGQQLEAELLHTAWRELVEVGFAKLTMESVAARARTGVAVLYRRWANKNELVLSAIQSYQSKHPIDLPDTGSLRGDLLAALTGMGKTRAAFFTTVTATAASGLLADTGLTPAQMRDKVMGDQRLSRVRSIYQRAHDRGEIDLASIPAAVLALPFDLVRHDLLMESKALKPARIQAILDEIFLPLVHVRPR